MRVIETEDGGRIEVVEWHIQGAALVVEMDGQRIELFLKRPANDALQEALVDAYNGESL